MDLIQRAIEAARETRKDAKVALKNLQEQRKSIVYNGECPEENSLIYQDRKDLENEQTLFIIKIARQYLSRFRGENYLRVRP